MKQSIILAILSTASAFAPSTPVLQPNLTSLNAEQSRRSIMVQTAATAVSALLIQSTPNAAFAEVSKGDSLPEGAAQFKRLLSLKSDLPAVIKRLSEGGADGSIDKKEWDALSDFMRKVYKGGDDMKAFVKGGGIYDPEKKKKAEEDFKLLQKLAQAGDGPISKEDATALKNVLTKADLVLEDFFELLRDVPDEI